MMEHAIPHLMSSASSSEDSSTIINVSSVTGQQSFGGCALYCASKAAVDMLTKCAAVDLAGSNIRVVRRYTLCNVFLYQFNQVSYLTF